MGTKNQGDSQVGSRAGPGESHVHAQVDHMCMTLLSSRRQPSSYTLTSNQANSSPPLEAVHADLNIPCVKGQPAHSRQLTSSIHEKGAHPGGHAGRLVAAQVRRQRRAARRQQEGCRLVGVAWLPSCVQWVGISCPACRLPALRVAHAGHAKAWRAGKAW